MTTTDVSPSGLTREYPRELKLASGKRIELRLAGANSGQELLAFARSLPKADLMFLRMDITDPHNIEEWLRNIERGRTITVMAYDGEKLVGWASLHHNEVLWTRHVGEIRTIVGAEYRNMRLGVRLVEEMFEVGKDIGLRKITAHMMSDQRGARAAFERIGFRPEALLADYTVDAEGRTHDMLIMSYDIDGFND
jgi:RimJ/RimL family protein N-acetyltransferase